MIEYTLTMNSEQAKECLKAVELLMRLKINQPEQISRSVMPEDYWEDGMLNKQKFGEYIKHRDAANDHLNRAFAEIFPTRESVKKDSEWYRLYNIYQVIRYQIHLAEYPNSTGVDSYPPRQFSEEPLPECKYERK